MRLRGSNCSILSIKSIDFGEASGYKALKFALCMQHRHANGLGADFWAVCNWYLQMPLKSCVAEHLHIALLWADALGSSGARIQVPRLCCRCSRVAGVDVLQMYIECHAVEAPSWTKHVSSAVSIAMLMPLVHYEL